MILTIKDFMERYQVSRSTVYRWIEKGMPVRRLGSIVRIDSEDADKWFKEQTDKGGE